jgi:lipopolysaccharide/colanic/teichoic acid biosynthesis glycosyltransferase
VALPAYHAEQLDTDALRATVLPGITGPWQVSFRSDGDLQIRREDDLSISATGCSGLTSTNCLQTVPAVLSRKGAR